MKRNKTRMYVMLISVLVISGIVITYSCGGGNKLYEHSGSCSNCHQPVKGFATYTVNSDCSRLGCHYKPKQDNMHKNNTDISCQSCHKLMYNPNKNLTKDSVCNSCHNAKV